MRGPVAGPNAAAIAAATTTAMAIHFSDRCAAPVASSPARVASAWLELPKEDRSAVRRSKLFALSCMMMARAALGEALSRPCP